MGDSAVPRRLVVGITGASGSIFGVRTLRHLRQQGIETHLIITPWGLRTLRHEMGLSLADVSDMATVTHKASDQGAAPSSGSFPTDGMIVIPCSVKSLAAISVGLASDLVARAADVTLKEHRPLVLVVRETPLNEIHLENMMRLARLGVTIMPPVPAFYQRPKSIEDIVDHTVARALDQLGVHLPSLARWDGELGEP